MKNNKNMNNINQKDINIGDNDSIQKNIDAPPNKFGEPIYEKVTQKKDDTNNPYTNNNNNEWNKEMNDSKKQNENNYTNKNNKIENINDDNKENNNKENILIEDEPLNYLLSEWDIYFDDGKGNKEDWKKYLLDSKIVKNIQTVEDFFKYWNKISYSGLPVYNIRIFKAGIVPSFDEKRNQGRWCLSILQQQGSFRGYNRNNFKIHAEKFYENLVLSVIGQEKEESNITGVVLQKKKQIFRAQIWVKGKKPIPKHIEKLFHSDHVKIGFEYKVATVY